ncbi:MAG: hypothetical protein ACOX4I_01810 [Anaerovoracaceae bacterium]|jgi:exopolyphosphatase/guanosine-5'-triphosphate,3'-diphosphate pyrophosphatase
MYAVIDIGSNTVRLSLYEAVGKYIEKLINKKETVGLANHIGKDNRLTEHGLTRLLVTLKSFDLLIKRMNVKKVIAFATASLRNIDNTGEVLDAIKESVDFDVRVLSGEEEGTFGYMGAIYNSGMKDGILMDIGGGSTEIVLFTKGELRSVRSLPIGSLNLFRNHVNDLLPTNKEIKGIKEDVKTYLKKLCGPQFESIGFEICGIGGTARTLCKMYNYSQNAEPANRIFPVSFMKKARHVLRDSRKDYIQVVLKTAPERIHTITPGMIILESAARLFDSHQVRISTFGVREGVLLDELRKESGQNE